jgi:integrase/recombinase XerC
MHDPLLYQSFLHYLKFEKRYSPHTVKAYQEDLQQFTLHLKNVFEMETLVGLLPHMIRNWLASLKEGGADAKTINRKISTLKSFFKFEIRSGRQTVNPMSTISGPKASRRLPVFVPETEMEQLLTGMEFPENWDGYNARMIFMLLYATGIRLSELIGLKPSHFDRGARLMKVLGKGNKERLLPVSIELLDQVQFYLDERNKLFGTDSEQLLVNSKGKALYPKYVYLLVKKYLSEVKTLDKKSPHILRHSFATHLSNHGAPINAVKDLLGHASLAATQVYTHNSIEKLREQYRKAHPRENKR